MRSKKKIIVAFATALAVMPGQHASANFELMTVSQPPLELAEALTKCAGQLNATARYSSYVDGLNTAAESSQRALDFMLSVIGSAPSSYQARAKEYGDLFDTQLLRQPIYAREVLRETVSACIRQIGFARVIQSNETKRAAAKAAATAEETRRSRLRFEAELARTKAAAEAELAKTKAEAEAKLEQAKAARIASEYDGQIQLENARQAGLQKEHEALLQLEKARQETLNNEALVEMAKVASKEAELQLERAKRPLQGGDASDEARRAPVAVNSKLEDDVAYLACGGLLNGLSMVPFDGLDPTRAKLLSKQYFDAAGADQEAQAAATQMIAAQIAAWNGQGVEVMTRQSQDLMQACGVKNAMSTSAMAAAEDIVSSAGSDIVMDDRDPYSGALCYSWANIVRSWWEQNAERAYMEAQAEGALENRDLYGLLLVTADVVAENSPRAKKLIYSNGWNKHCVAKLTGRA